MNPFASNFFLQTYNATEYNLKDSPDANPHWVFDPEETNEQKKTIPCCRVRTVIFDARNSFPHDRCGPIFTGGPTLAGPVAGGFRHDAESAGRGAYRPVSLYVETRDGSCIHGAARKTRSPHVENRISRRADGDHGRDPLWTHRSSARRRNPGRVQGGAIVPHADHDRETQAHGAGQ